MCSTLKHVHINLIYICLPYTLYCASVWIGSVQRCHKAAHRDVFVPGDMERVWEEHRALINVFNNDMDGDRRAGAVADTRNQRIFIFHFDE